MFATPERKVTTQQDPQVIIKDKIIEKEVEKIVEVESNLDVDTPSDIKDLENKVDKKLKEKKQ